MEYINSIYSVVNISVPENETVVVIEPEFIRKVFLLLENTSPRVLGISQLMLVNYVKINNSYMCSNSELHALASSIENRRSYQSAYELNIFQVFESTVRYFLSSTPMAYVRKQC